jgi:6-phosphogluconolactonase
MTLETYPDRDVLNMDVADEIASALRTALSQNDTVSLAVAGGSTPGPIFDILSGVSLDWARVRVVPTDERWVPEDHPRSNAALIRTRLLTGRAAAATLVPLYAEGTPEDALPGLIAAVEPCLPLSVVLLGMGADMHTASLFPGAPGTAEALAPDAPPLCIVTPPDQPEARVTLSAATLNDALDKHLVIVGPDKRAAYEAALRLPPEQAPIHAVVDGIKTHWTETD